MSKRQAKHSAELLHTTQTDCKLDGLSKFTRLLDLSDLLRCEPYHRRALEFKPQLHWGQLKLFLTEVEFLTLVTQQAQRTDRAPPTGQDQKLNKETRIILIYPGAAPGNHTNYLHTMFPDMEFHLYDLQKFATKPNSKIKLYEQYFTDDDAKKWRSEIDDIRKTGVNLFVALCSDIRTEPATEDEVARNMEMQRVWWEIIEPDLTMFKFRLPWKPGVTLYPKGDIYIQPFAGQTSTETRLIFKKKAPLIEYKNEIYEQAMFFHNTKARNCLWPNQFSTPPTLKKDGFCSCYDCSALIWILVDYLGWSHDKSFTEKEEDELKTLIHSMERQIGGNRKQTIYSQTLASHKEIKSHIRNYKNNPELLKLKSDEAIKKQSRRDFIKPLSVKK